MRRYAALRRRRYRRPVKKSVDLQRRIVRGVLLLSALMLILIFLFGDHGLYQLYRLRAQRAEIQRTIAELRSNKKELEAEKTRLETDYKYIEQLAREKYRMAKKGEKVFKVIKTPPREE